MVLILWGCVTVGCDRREQQRCRMASEYVVGKTQSAPRSLAALRLDDQRVAVFWSADGRVYYALLSNAGIPTSTPVQIEAPKHSTSLTKTWWHHHTRLTLDAVSLSPVRVTQNEVALAMLCHQGKNAAVVVEALVDLKKKRVIWLKRIGDTGLFVRKITQSIAGDHLLVGFQDTRTTPQSVALAAIDVKNGHILKQTHIKSKEAIYGPELAQNKGSNIVLWTVVDTHAKKVRLYSAGISGDLSISSHHFIDSLELFDAAVDVTPSNDGFAAVFRDNRDGDRTEEFYFTILDKTGSRLQPAKRISRADGPQGPRLSRGKTDFYSASVRSYNNNYLVGFNRFDKTGTKLGGEFQVYADKCDFIRADLVTHGDDVILVYGENADTGGRILAATISCDRNPR